jgi:3',5'-cyclic AMP phosphodiesterase CpdA
MSKVKAHNGERMVNDGESNYFYLDFPYDKVRVVMLNTTDGNYENSFDSVSQISERQLEWFKSEALNTNYNVIVVSHIPLVKEFPGNDSSVVKNGDAVRGAVEEFIKNGGNFVAYFCGHTHIQSDMVDENGRLHVSFKNGGTVAEVVAINFKARKIYTFGLGNVEGRDFVYWPFRASRV